MAKKKNESIDELTGDVETAAVSGFVVVNHKGLGVLSLLGLVDLIPGVNSVPAAMWEKVKDHHLTVIRIEDGALEVVSETEDKTDNILSDMTETKAMKIVTETVDMSLLQAWEGKETRQKVRTAIRKQIAELEKPIGEGNE